MIQIYALVLLVVVGFPVVLYFDYRRLKGKQKVGFFRLGWQQAFAVEVALMIVFILILAVSYINLSKLIR